ncbi:hypothetical protein KIN20_005759 [Parelaphostrongylus tenuis]|uniref:Uncharacterized protein n=1 Tax=Parelaphostrongylus tenuis TaxID=148309 RepID=A0AAD5QGB0_PARTN|nr:hypothetical protein KIN20_005759 [Parelaphostrongylus tenuis]
MTFLNDAIERSVAKKMMIENINSTGTAWIVTMRTNNFNQVRTVSYKSTVLTSLHKCTAPLCLVRLDVTTSKTRIDRGENSYTYLTKIVYKASKQVLKLKH